MNNLASLKNSSQPKRQQKRVGRGWGSGIGKTCRRGQKGQGARSGYKRRYGNEGGQFPLYMKLPVRGFSNVRFRTEYEVINLDQIDAMFDDGDVVSIETLKQRGYLSGPVKRLKILGNGNITKKVTIHADHISASAREKLNQAKIKIEKI